MKRIFTSLIALFAMLTTASAEAFDCEITTTEVGPYSVTVKFTPADDSKYYICSVALKSGFDSMGEKGVMSYFLSTMDASIAEGSASSYAEFGHQGEYIYSNSKLNPETEYIVFAYSYSTTSGNATSSMKTLTFTTPKDSPSETDINLHIVSTHWVDKVETAGFWQITGWTSDYGHYVQFCADPATKKTGTFTLTDTSWDWDYTGVYYYPGEGTYPTKRTCKAMTLVITETDGIYNFKCDYTDNRDVTYHITFDPYDPDESEGNTYDMSQNVEASFSAAEGKVSYNAAESCFTVVYQNADNEYFEAVMYTPGDKLEDGEYTIDDTNQDFTVEPCSMDDDNNIYGSVYGTLTDEGYMNNPWFWFTSGTITVSHNDKGELQMYVDAVNSKNKTCKISINGDTSIGAVAGSKIKVPASKYLENGRIVIENAGSKYNAAGIELK